MSIPTRNRFPKEKGAATLVTVVVLLAILMLTTLTLSNISSYEIREASDAVRQKVSLSAGQAGLDVGAMTYLSDPSATVSGAGSTLASIGDPSTYSYIVSGTSSAINISATGLSPDLTGSATVTESFGMASTLGFGELVPFLAAASIPTGGNFSIVANPNGAGDGVPISAWVEGAGINGKASWQTCNQDEYYYDGGVGCNTDTDKICNSDSPEGNCEDFVVENCVPDPLGMILQIDMPRHDSTVAGITCGSGNFTSAKATWTEYKEDHALSCSDLNSVGAGGLKNGPFEAPFAWVSSDCKIDTTVGSSSAPVIAVIEGDIELTDDFYGILIMFSEQNYPDSPSYGNPNHVFKITGNNKIHGAVMLMGDISHTTGTSEVVYDKDILDFLSGNGEGFSGLARIKGTWHDFN